MNFRLVRSRGLEPPRVAPLPPQGSASTSSATTAFQKDAKRPISNSAAFHKLSAEAGITYQTLISNASGTSDIPGAGDGLRCRRRWTIRR